MTRRQFATIPGAGIAAQTGAAQSAPTHPEDFFFAIVADPQLGHHTLSDDMRQETATYEFTIASLNRLHPAFVVVVGDMTNRPENATQFAEYKRIWKLLDPGIRLFHVAGNHDCHTHSDPETMGSVTAGALAWYRDSYGPDRLYFRYRMFGGIILNSSLIYNPANAKEERQKQDEWLVKYLRIANREELDNIVVFQHWPFFVNDIGEPDDYLNLPRPDRTRYLDLFREHKVKKVYSGHLHRNLLHKANEIELVTTSACGARLPARERHGIRIVKIRNRQIFEEFYDLGSVPNWIRMS